MAKRQTPLDLDEEDIGEVEADPVVAATVARGRTVRMADHAHRRMAGFDSTGRPIYATAIITIGPGGEVKLPLSEVKKLRESGFLVDPDAKDPVVQDEGVRVLDSAAIGFVATATR